MNQPVVDVVIAVHDLRRAVDRAVASVLNGTRTAVRVTVVAHGLGAQETEQRVFGTRPADPRVRVVAFADGVSSPAGPFNHGLDLAKGEFTSVMGSDDVLEPGAIDTWYRCATRTGADVVIAQTRHGAGPLVRTPPVRLGRTAALDGVKDRLAYRSAPLGLVSRSRFGHLRFTQKVATGEDIAYSNTLWFSGARIAYARGAGYVIMDDDAARVTFAAKPVAQDFAFLPAVLAGFGVEPARFVATEVGESTAASASRALGTAADAAARGGRDLTAFVTKFLRVHVFGAVHNRAAGTWGPRDRADLADAAAQVLSLAPQAAEPLSRADRRLLDAVLDTTVPEEVLLAAATARRQFTHLATLVPRNLAYVAHREAPVRFMCASLALGR